MATIEIKGLVAKRGDRKADGTRGPMRYYIRGPRDVAGKERLHRLPDPADPAFAAELKRLQDVVERERAILKGGNPAVRAQHVDSYRRDTIDALIDLHKQRPKYRDRAPRTISDDNYHLAEIGRVLGFGQVSNLSPPLCQRFLESYSDRPHRHNNLRRVLIELLETAVRSGAIATNPATPTETMRHRVQHHKPWPDLALKAWRELATPLWVDMIEFMRITGQSQTDAISIPWSDFRSDLLDLTRKKTGVPVSYKPSRWPELMAVAKRLERHLIDSQADRPIDMDTSLPLLRTQKGAPWGTGFGNTFQNQRRRVLRLLTDPSMRGSVALTDPDAPAKADALKQVKLHGLRCNSVVELFKLGLSKEQVAAIVGHETLKMTEQYGSTFYKQSLVDSAFDVIERSTVDNVRPLKV